MRFLIFVLSSLTALIVAAPLAEPGTDLETRASIDTGTHCGTWDTVQAGQYSLNLNQWGINGATGSQCAGLKSLSGTTVSWWTTWSWSSNGGVKSFTNIQLNTNLNKKLSAIKSIPSTWNWSYSSYSMTADVAYDLFTSNSAGGSHVMEVMIWLANINAGPLSTSYPAKPIASNLSIAGKSWNLYEGPNGNTKVFSFLPTSGRYTSFSGDINLFLQYLVQHQGVSSSEYLTTAQGGTEPFAGSATLTTSSFSMSIN
ncbi:concanavalin A-like lectin/glucanase [Rickenella mellea]|uniref:Concanavalin A-like lectin/glucanase n=1 Tax=Rickenella mellea TaxID=50990 RepID=A0A4Y7PZM9_9AGAM|nr:concanavalin A-like lectin/glucanase [Rickenella mellea]